MPCNPYKYNGPLDPIKDKPVCISRTEKIHCVINGIMREDYWVILGPRQTGKTTFLRQIQNTYTDAYYVYFDLIIYQEKDKNFFQSLRNQVIDKIPLKQTKRSLSKAWDNDTPGLSFISFLKKLKTKDDTKRIIFLFDEIEAIPELEGFLDLWRKIFQDSYYEDSLKRISVIIAGSTNLISLTSRKPNSPFNIANTLYIKDFENSDSETLIDKPFKKLKIKIDQRAKNILISQISGHPQLLQHACCILVDKSSVSGNLITEKEVNETIESLIISNSSLDTLRENLEEDKNLRNIVRDILAGKGRKFHLNKKHEVSGAGAVVNENSLCKIRNEVYKKVIGDFLKDRDKKSDRASGKKGKKISRSNLDIFFNIFSIFLGIISCIEESSPVVIISALSALLILSIVRIFMEIKDAKEK